MTDANLNLAWAALRKANPELPETYHLTEAHTQALADRGITAEQACVAGIFSASAETAYQYTGHKDAGILFPYFDHHGVLQRWTDEKGESKPYFRLRLDVPKGDKGEMKYASAYKSGSKIYLPRTAGHQWRNKSNDLLLPLKLLLIEGEFKALCATLHKMPAIGVGGVDCYATGPKGEDGKRELGWLVDEANLLSIDSLTVVYDNDIIFNTSVQGAMSRFARKVVEAYREKELAKDGKTTPWDTLKLEKILRYALLPNLGGTKKDDRIKLGVDDAIVQLGALNVSTLLEKSLPLVALSIDKKDSTSIDIKQLFCCEPLGDDAPKENKNLQSHMRQLIGWLSLAQNTMMVSGMGAYSYDKEAGIWKPKSREWWANLPQKVADGQDWVNRSKAPMAEMASYLNSALSIEADELNPQKYLAFGNGVLDLDTKELAPHNPKFRMTRKLGFEYDPTAECDEFVMWLLHIFAEEMPDGKWNSESRKTMQMVALIQALLAVTLHRKEDKAFPFEIWPYLYGRSGAGKSTFLNVLEELLGEAAGSWDLDNINDPNNVHSLNGKLAAICNDLEGKMNPKISGAIKQIASNEKRTCKSLYYDVYKARLNCILWSASQHEVIGNQGAEGLARRVIQINFNRKVDSPDPHFKAEMTRELPGIYNWATSITWEEAIEVIRLYQSGEESIAGQIDGLQDRNSVAQWVNDITETDMERACPHGIETPGNKLYIIYSNWCAFNRIEKVSATRMGKELPLAGTKFRRSGGKHFTIPLHDNIDWLSWARG